MEFDKDTLAVIERFYQIWEENENYTRPVDWLERAARVLRGDFTGRRQGSVTVMKNSMGTE